MHEEWEAGLRSRGMCSQGCHWGAGSPEHMGLPSCSCCQCHGGDDATGLARAGQGLWGQGQLPVAPTASSELQIRPPGAASKVCLAGHVSCLCNYPQNERTKRLLNAEVFFSVSSFSGRGEMAQGSGDWGQS